MSPLSYIEKADAFWPVKLVAAGRKHIDFKLVHMDGNLARGLHGIRMEGDSRLPRDLPNLRNRLDGANFVVGKHAAD